MKRFAAVVLTAAFVLVTALVHVGPSNGGPPVPAPRRIALIVLENRSYGQIIGNRRAPYINSLARRGALATHYYAIAHPSLPNYVALTTGGHAEVNSDCATCGADGRNLVNQLDAAGISWRAYFESLRGRATAAYVKGASYNRHYNPFVYSESVSPGDLSSKTTDFAGLRRDLAAQTLPRFSWIAPNIFHDGHTSKLAAVDRYTARLVPEVLKALGPHGLLLLTWDEGRPSDASGAHGSGGGHVPLIAVGPAARAGARVAVRANHYALLKTIEAMLHLGRLGHARDANTPVLAGLLRQR